MITEVVKFEYTYRNIYYLHCSDWIAGCTFGAKWPLYNCEGQSISAVASIYSTRP